jgi:hypothetical protein
MDLFPEQAQKNENVVDDADFWKQHPSHADGDGDGGHYPGEHNQRAGKVDSPNFLVQQNRDTHRYGKLQKEIPECPVETLPHRLPKSRIPRDAYKILQPYVFRRRYPERDIVKAEDERSDERIGEYQENENDEGYEEKYLVQFPAPLSFHDFGDKTTRRAISPAG